MSIKIDKQTQILSRIIRGQFGEAINYKTSSSDIKKPAEYKYAVNKILSGFINKSKLKRLLSSLLLIEINYIKDPNKQFNQIINFKKYCQYLINYDTNKRIEKFLIKFCQKSYVLKALLLEEINDDSIIKILKQILVEVNYKHDNLWGND